MDEVPGLVELHHEYGLLRRYAGKQRVADLVRDDFRRAVVQHDGGHPHVGHVDDRGYAAALLGIDEAESVA